MVATYKVVSDATIPDGAISVAHVTEVDARSRARRHRRSLHRRRPHHPGDRRSPLHRLRVRPADMSAMSAVEFAVVGAIGYFVVFRFGFLFRPELADRFGLAWVRPAGKANPLLLRRRVMGPGRVRRLPVEPRPGVGGARRCCFLAVAVLTTRVVGTVVDRAADDPYTRLAIPTETAFVLALALVRFTA